MTYIAGEDVDTQRRGLAIVVWFDESFKLGPNISPERLLDFTNLQFTGRDLGSMRPCSIHCCVPDTLAHRIVVSVMKIQIGKRTRLRLKTHIGQPMELLYKLQSFGIPTEHIPVSFSGTIKTGYFKQWTRSREAQESSVYLEMSNDFRGIIECPRLGDVLFRQGISLVANPGNAQVRSIIQQMMKEGQNETEAGGVGNNKQKSKVIKLKRREMVLDIIDEVSKTSRFLTWNEGGWWNELLDREQIILKIEYLIKDVRKSNKAKRQYIKVNSSSSIFLPDQTGSSNARHGAKRPRLNSYGQLTDSSDDDKSMPCAKGFFS